jgi:hypothetical protein
MDRRTSPQHAGRCRDRRPRRSAVLVLLVLPFTVLASSARAQGGTGTVEYGGFLEGGGVLFAARPNRSDARAIGVARLQLWSRGPAGKRLSWRARWDLELDTHGDVGRDRWLDLSQRGLLRPAGGLGELYVDAKLGRVDLRAGKQEIRWGRADGFNPTDNLIPYDYLDLFSERRLAVPAVKADFYAGSARLEGVWIPFHTPTRVPRLGQRWFPQLPRTARAAPVPGAEPVEVDLAYRDGAATFPARTLGNGQWGVRYNQLVPRAEFSVSFFEGFDDLPAYRVQTTLVDATAPPRVEVRLDRQYPRVRVYGGDFASQLGPFGLRGEAAWFDRAGTSPGLPGSATPARDYALFVLGIDRAWGDWFGILQFAGQKLAGGGGAAVVFPELGLRSTLLGRLERTLGADRSLELKAGVRLRDGDFFLQPLYNVALSNRWRLKLGATLLGGPSGGFFGQYAENGNVTLHLRYTF